MPAAKSMELPRWACFSSWTAEELASLLCGQSPDRAQNNEDPEVQLLKRQIERAMEDGTLRPRPSPGEAIAWAERVGVPVPRKLRSAVESSSESVVDLVDENKTLTNQITDLKRQLADLKSGYAGLAEANESLRADKARLDQQWPGHDPESRTYPPLLDIALQAWTAVKNQRPPQKGIKQALLAWLKKHYPMLPDKTADCIASCANWDKAGGRPRSAD